MECPFCEICNNESNRIIYKDNSIVVFPTNIPITPGHVLVCPTRHVQKIDELTDNELKSLKTEIVLT